jgi:hypothetical protein
VPKTTAEIQIDYETALAIMRDEREAEEHVNGTFYLVGHRPGEDPMMAIVPCVETPAVTVLLIPMMSAQEDMTIDSVAMAMDTYRFSDNTRPDPGVDLATLFAAGDPRVSEALVVACVDKDGPGWYYTQTYVAIDNKIVWGDIEDINENADLYDDGERAHHRSIRRELEGLLR